MTSIPSGISTIIFDLGGVIVDLSVKKTIQEFAGLAGWPETKVAEVYITYPEFFAFERGEISDSEFRNMLRKVFSLQVTDQELDFGWNAMLVGLPVEKLKLVEKLKKQFKVLVLSNTNNIHIQFVNSNLLGGTPLDSHFDKCYYSHDVGMRKPEPGIYQHVLHDSGVVAESAIFLDDNLENIQAAKELGIHTVHIQHPDEVYAVFKGLV